MEPLQGRAQVPLLSSTWPAGHVGGGAVVVVVRGGRGVVEVVVDVVVGAAVVEVVVVGAGHSLAVVTTKLKG